MSLRIITIDPAQAVHWEYAKRNQFWDLTRGTNLLETGDDVLFRVLGRDGRFAGRAVVSHDPEAIAPQSPSAWSEHDVRDYRVRVQLQQFQDLDPIRITWNELVGLGAPKRPTPVTAIQDEDRRRIEGRLGLTDDAYEEAARAVAENPDDLVDMTEDRRERVPATVVVRRGQPAFRRRLMDAYAGRCAVTGTPFQPILEAAHISPYRGEHTNAVANGLLLRSDVHTLFDLSLLTVDLEGAIRLAPELRDTDYGNLHGVEASRPEVPEDAPAPENLRLHHRTCAWMSNAPA